MCDEVVSAQYVPAVNMAEELLEAVEKLQSRLSENQEPRKVGRSRSTSERTHSSRQVIIIMILIIKQTVQEQFGE